MGSTSATSLGCQGLARSVLVAWLALFIWLIADQMLPSLRPSGLCWRCWMSLRPMDDHGAMTTSGLSSAIGRYRAGHCRDRLRSGPAAGCRRKPAPRRPRRATLSSACRRARRRMVLTARDQFVVVLECSPCSAGSSSCGSPGPRDRVRSTSRRDVEHLLRFRGVDRGRCERDDPTLPSGSRSSAASSSRPIGSTRPAGQAADGRHQAVVARQRLSFAEGFRWGRHRRIRTAARTTQARGADAALTFR